MNRYSFFTSIILLFYVVGLFAQTQEKRPNVIFILADDLGAGDLNCTGHPYAKTPNLDQLANGGIRFERAYMAGAWCSPSRFGLMSGKYPARDFYETHNLNPKEPSITKILSNGGYNTAHFGKWHLNKGTDYVESVSEFGIDEFFIYNGPSDGHTWTKEQKADEYLRAKSTDFLVDKTISFINDYHPKKSNKPFYINLWIYPTHSYIHPTKDQLKVYEGLKVDYQDFSKNQQEFLKFVENYGDINQAMQAYCADITAMDKALGRLFEYLKNNDLDENTIIVFSSDNGPGPLTKQIGNGELEERYKQFPDLINSVGSAKIFKDRKLSLHEGGIRVPFIVYWPEKIKGGLIDKSSVIHGIDWLPTVASLCNVKLPEGLFDGIDMAQTFIGNEKNRKTPVFWKENGSSAILRGNWKGVMSKDKEFELYNIGNDPYEFENLQSKKTKISANLKRDLQMWLESVD